MVRHAVTAACLLVALASGVARADDARMTAAECAVWNRELSFAQSVDAHDARAFRAHLHPGAVFNVATSAPVRGRDAVAAAWADIVAGKDLLVWRPRYVSIGGDRNVAASRGPYYTRGADGQFLVGMFSSVWVRRSACAPWLILFDGAAGAPTPVADEAAARAFVAAAPATCPGG